MIFKDLQKLQIEFFRFFMIFVGLIKECIYVYLSMQIQENMFMSIAAYLQGCF